MFYPQKLQLFLKQSTDEKQTDLQLGSNHFLKQKEGINSEIYRNKGRFEFKTQTIIKTSNQWTAHAHLAHSAPLQRTGKSHTLQRAVFSMTLALQLGAKSNITQFLGGPFGRNIKFDPLHSQVSPCWVEDVSTGAYRQRSD